MESCSVRLSAQLRPPPLFQWQWKSSVHGSIYVFVSEKMISHGIPICFRTLSSHCVVGWGHVINSRLTSRPEHLKAGIGPSSSLARTHVPNDWAVRYKQQRSESTRARATHKSSWTYSGILWAREIKLYVYMS